MPRQRLVTVESDENIEIGLPDSGSVAVRGDYVEVTTYYSPNDGCPVIEIETNVNSPSEIRVYVNDGQIFAGDPERRYLLKEDAGPMRYYGIWDNVQNTWFVGEDGGPSYDTYYFAGVPMWQKEKDARTVLDQLNERTGA